jgi:hypothetical protein
LGGTATCQAGHCVLTCATGHEDCNGDASDGCEADLSADRHHCGACNKDCGDWGDCFQTTCVEILATEQAAFVGADELLVHEGLLYWDTPGITENGEIARVAVTGGASEPFYSDKSWPDGLKASSNGLIWSNVTKPGIYRMASAGQAQPDIVWTPNDGTNPYVLAADDTTIYFTTGADVRAIPVQGGAPTVLAQGLINVSAARIVGSILYVVDLGPEIYQPMNGGSFPGHPEGTISALNLSTLSLSAVAQHLDTPVSVIPANGALYWAESGSLTTYAGPNNTGFDAGTLGRVVRANMDGSSPTVVADKLVHPGSLAADAAHVYWVDTGTVGGKDPSVIAYVSNGDVMRAPLTGGPAETVMPSIDARSLAMDQDSIYFASWFYGIIFRKSK